MVSWIIFLIHFQMFQRALEEKRLALDKAKDAERAAIQSCQDKSAKLEAYDKVFQCFSIMIEL